MDLLVYLIFGLSYLLIASRQWRFLPIGRTAGALLGATLMVLVGALSPEESYAAVNHDTLLLLFAMMVLTASLEQADFFGWIAGRILRISGTPMKLLIFLVFLSGVLSAFLVNDAVCLFLTPVVVALCRAGKLPFAPFLIALATSSNIGSSATLVGNPQNMIIGSLSGMDFGRFLCYSGPVALLGLGVNAVLLRLMYGKSLPDRLELESTAEVKADWRKLAPPLMAAILIVACFFAGFHMGYAALAGVMALVVAQRKDAREILLRVDYSLLVFFAGLFIVVAGLATTGIADRAWAAAAPSMALNSGTGTALFALLMTAGSNLVSNVPMVLLTGPSLASLGSPEFGWVLMAFTTTIAGNLTLVGSVANLIVAEGARDAHTLGFFEYLRFGLLSTLLVMALGCGLLFWIMA